jgi:hypothetical protein
VVLRMYAGRLLGWSSIAGPYNHYNPRFAATALGGSSTLGSLAVI